MTQGNRDELLPSDGKKITVRRARTHNLQGIDVEIPHGKLTVVTGVSGSGKSSLVFDTIFAEGQRQYVNSMATQSRRLLDILPKPPVDSIHGLQPTLCIEQVSSRAHSRSTVATLAEIYDYLRLLMARAGTPYCHACGALIQQQSTIDILADILAFPIGTKLTIMAPVVRGRRGAHHDTFATLAKAGLVKARVDGVMIEIDEPPTLVPNQNHNIEAVCDRIIVREGTAERIEAAVQVALKLADGLVSLSIQLPQEDLDASGVGSSGDDRLYSTKYACPDCGLSYAEIAPRMFSFNSPYGACPDCNGSGTRPSNTAADTVPDVASAEQFEVEGTEEDQSCYACDGTRLRPESRSILLSGMSIDRITAMTVAEALDWFEKLSLTGLSATIAKPIVLELIPRLQFLNRIGVGYLQLDRCAQSLSGGELQRVRLATSLGSGLIGVCYILDEPSIGLHPRDSERLIETLYNLRDQGNTLIVVEHDVHVMQSADFLIDMGPGAGKLGGRILASGSPSTVAEDPDSVTGPFLRQTTSSSSMNRNRSSQAELCICLKGLSNRNLKNIDVAFPLQCLLGVTGVSGSGKSTLVREVLVPVVKSYLQRSKRSSTPTYSESYVASEEVTSVSGLENIDKLIVVDQQPIGRNARSTPATYTGLWDLIREVIAQTREAKQRGFKAARFSFNAGPGRCDACQGMGQRLIEMGFLADVYATCDRCGGARFNRPTLAVRYKEKNIAEILAMSVDEALSFFRNFTKIASILESMARVGLGYLTLGQPSQTLSGGEAQRVKLATELARPSTFKTLYVLDEPTSGLHPLDVAQLMKALQDLVDLGNSVIVIEHNLDVIRECDWLIDLGPEGGPQGGQLLAAGTPQTIAACPASATGRYLR